MQNLFENILKDLYFKLNIFVGLYLGYLSAARCGVKLKMAASIANYQEVIESLHDPEVLLIDVRDPSDIEDSGSIPKSINIPSKFSY